MSLSLPSPQQPSQRLPQLVMLPCPWWELLPHSPLYPQPNFDFDKDLLAALEAGKGRQLLDLTPAELDAAGNIELRTWMVVMGAIGAELFYKFDLFQLVAIGWI